MVREYTTTVSWLSSWKVTLTVWYSQTVGYWWAENRSIFDFKNLFSEGQGQEQERAGIHPLIQAYECNGLVTADPISPQLQRPQEMSSPSSRKLACKWHLVERRTFKTKVIEKLNNCKGQKPDTQLALCLSTKPLIQRSFESRVRSPEKTYFKQY